MAEACEARGLPLLEVPEELSFATIADAVADATAHLDPGLRRQLFRTRRLLELLAAGGGRDVLLELLRRETGLDAALVGPGGRVLVPGRAPVPRAVAREAARLARRGRLPAPLGSASCAFGPASETVLGSAVVVGAALGDLSDDARLAVEQVSAYVVLESARLQAAAEAQRALAAELLALAWSGDLGAAAFAARARGLGLDPDAPLRAVVLTGAWEDAVYVAAGVGGRSLAASHGERPALLLQDDGGEPPAELLELLEEGGEALAAGVGEAHRGPEGLRRSLAEALAAHAVARERPPGQRVVRQLEVGSHATLLGFVERPVQLAFRAAVLGPVEAWDADHGTELVRTVAAFLAHHGHWRRTAAALHVHHNTLRYRLERVAALSGRSAEETAGRVDLALALAVAPPAP
jgi:hypothetical protein